MAKVILSPKDQDTGRRIAAWLTAKGVAFATSDFALTDEGKGPYLSKWDEAKLGPRPTPAEIADTPPEPLPPDPSDELVAAILDAIKNEPANSPVRNLGEALVGQTSKGRVAGRPV